MNLTEFNMAFFVKCIIVVSCNTRYGSLFFILPDDKQLFAVKKLYIYFPRYINSDTIHSSLSIILPTKVCIYVRINITFVYICIFCNEMKHNTQIKLKIIFDFGCHRRWG